MESTYDFTIRRNKELSKQEGCDLVHFLVTSRYSTKSQNRESIETEVYQGVRKGAKIFNKIKVHSVATDLVRNYEPTKSTIETHQKKIDKLPKYFENIIMIEDYN